MRPVLCLALAAALLTGCASAPKPDGPTHSTVTRSGLTWAGLKDGVQDWAYDPAVSHQVQMAKAVVFVVVVVGAVAGLVALLIMYPPSPGSSIGPR